MSASSLCLVLATAVAARSETLKSQSPSLPILPPISLSTRLPFIRPPPRYHRARMLQDGEPVQEYQIPPSYRTPASSSVSDITFPQLILPSFEPAKADHSLKHQPSSAQHFLHRPHISQEKTDRKLYFHNLCNMILCCLIDPCYSALKIQRVNSLKNKNNFLAPIV